jgi:hypothetical protein
MGKTKPKTKKQDGLTTLVGRVANELLGEEGEISARQLVNSVLEGHEREVKREADVLVRKHVTSVAKSILRRRADAPLQQDELPLGLPEEWLIAVRGEKGQLTYVLAHEANEDDLLGAEKEREHRVKQAEAAVANAGDSAKRALVNAQRDLQHFRTLVSRIQSNGGEHE